MADAGGFQMDIERQYYSATVPEGKILSQLPPPGTQVRRGWQIRVAQSLGPQRVEIPNVLGESQRAAEINIRPPRIGRGRSRADWNAWGTPGPGARPKSAAERQRYRGAQDQSADDRIRATAGISHAQLHRPGARRRNSGFAGRGIPIRERQYGSLSLHPSSLPPRILLLQ